MESETPPDLCRYAGPASSVPADRYGYGGRGDVTSLCRKGHPLQPGDTIGIVAPATHSEDIALAPHLEALHAMGYKTCLAPSALHRYGYFAGTDSERADDINACFRDNRIDAILCLNGGYGSARILDRLDYAMIAAHPKLLIGFSDITALEAALYEKAIS